MDAKLLTAERFVRPDTGISYRYVYSDTEYFRPHYHDYCELFLVLEGKATHFVNGRELPLSKGMLVFVRPADTHDYAVREGMRFSMLNMTFTKGTAEELFSYLGEGFGFERLWQNPLPPAVTLGEQGFSYLLSQMAGIRAIGEDEVQRLKTALRVLLFRIFTRFFADFGDEDRSELPRWLAELLAEMQKNGNFVYGIARMLSLTDKSREHVSRSVKKHLGVTLSEYVNGLRLNFIANMLKNSNHSVTDIVFESGFGNLGWASELFVKKYGMTMSDYRKKI